MPETEPSPTILLLDHTGELGGAERVLLELTEDAASAGFRTLVACSGGALRTRLIAQGTETWELRLGEALRTVSREVWRQSPWRVLWQARELGLEAWRLAARAREAQVTLIQTNTLKAHILGALVARLAGLPLVWHMHDMPSSRGDTRRLLQVAALIRRPRGILAVSQAAASDLPLDLQSLVRVVHNGIDLSAFDAAAAQSRPCEAWPEAPARVVGAVSWLIPWKGLDVLITAFASLSPRHPDLRLVIVGDTIFQWREERQRLEHLARALGLTERVVFLGAREDVPSLLRRMDLFVHPSRFEPFGRVLLEAMAAERAVVACAAGGVPEVVAADVSGLLVPPGEAEPLAAAIETLLADPQRAAQLGRAGRLRAAQHFSLASTRQAVYAAWRSWCKDQA
ncbi:MAG: glycosyltransferase family 4 protein [Candidatus Sericytochromatia bacterium]|nr:glycosyltransferase family 4 protein [Candidatus Sericytochromatia bacterium]